MNWKLLFTITIKKSLKKFDKRNNLCESNIMKRHNSNGMKKVIKQLRKLGVIMRETKNGAFLTHPQAKTQYLMHYSEKAIHPVRKWVKRELGFEVKF